MIRKKSTRRQKDRLNRSDVHREAPIMDCGQDERQAINRMMELYPDAQAILMTGRVFYLPGEGKLEVEHRVWAMMPDGSAAPGMRVDESSNISFMDAIENKHKMEGSL